MMPVCYYGHCQKTGTEYFAPYGFVTIDGVEMDGTHCMSRDHAFTCDSYDGKRFLVKEFERLK